jgi:hypothetical protein
MVEQSFVELGNAIIILSCADDPFGDGLTTGYLEFYDERHRPHFPLTSQVIRDHLLTILNESFCHDLWKAGRITGWIEALLENCPQTFRSLAPEERVTISPEA